MSVLSKPYFHDEEKAFAYLESVLWADGAVCPHCGALDRITKVKANPSKRIRLGLWRCGHCKGQFTVKVGTVFEHARIPLHKMLQAVYLMTSSKKGISSHQLHRILEITYKSAWFLTHRIREAMREGSLATFMFHGVGFDVPNGARCDVTFLAERLASVEADEKRIGSVIGAHSSLNEGDVVDLFKKASTKDAAWAQTVGIINAIREPQIAPGVPIHTLVFQR